jgi:hypothetical protein
VNAISDLWNGRFGLAKTYWLWGVLFGIPWGIALSLVTPGSNLVILVALAVFAYYVIVHVVFGVLLPNMKVRMGDTRKIAVAITPACLRNRHSGSRYHSCHTSTTKQAQEITSATQTLEKNEKPILNSINSNQQDTSEDQKLLQNKA